MSPWRKHQQKFSLYHLKKLLWSIAMIVTISRLHQKRQTYPRHELLHKQLKSRHWSLVMKMKMISSRLPRLWRNHQFNKRLQKRNYWKIVMTMMISNHLPSLLLSQLQLLSKKSKQSIMTTMRMISNPLLSQYQLSKSQPKRRLWSSLTMMTMTFNPHLSNRDSLQSHPQPHFLSENQLSLRRHRLCYVNPLL